MKSTTSLSLEDLSKVLSVVFGFDVDVYYMRMDNLSDKLLIEWEKLE